MEIYLKAEIYNSFDDKSPLAVSKICTSQMNNKNQLQLILKDLDTGKLTENLEVNALLYTERGVQPVEASVMFILPSKQVNLLIHRLNDKIERRSSLKVRVNIQGEINSFLDENNNWTSFQPPIPVDLKNLSVGGALFISDHQFEAGCRASMTLPPSIIPFPLFFTILRSEPNFVEHNYSYGCRFDPLAPNVDALLCRYIYQRQILLHRQKVL